MSNEQWSGAVYVEDFSRAALKVTHENETAWIPKSQIDDDSEVWDDQHVGQEGELVIPLWLAEKEGWA